MDSPKQILCSSCQEPLWVVRPMADGRDIYFPAQPESPKYSSTIHQCPFCEQSIYLGKHRGLVRDERSGRVQVA